MGAWDATSFGNDSANDWAYELEQCDDLSFIDATLQRMLDIGSEYLESDEASEAIAASEVLAWLRGQPTEIDAYTEKLADWVKSHPIHPPAALISKALAALDRIQGDQSELKELWESDPDWAASLTDLRARLTA